MFCVCGCLFGNKPCLTIKIIGGANQAVLTRQKNKALVDVLKQAENLHPSRQWVSQ